MTTSLTRLPFNTKPATTLHLDLNSCFASCEQLADPHLRGRPVAVAAYVSPRGCIVSPSIEAKKLGIKTGMQVQQGRQLCRDLVVLAPDPEKYRTVHQKFRRLLSEYTDKLAAKSIDEFVLEFAGCPALKNGMLEVAQEIKRRIRQEVGESLTVSAGIAPNRFLAKLASGLQKPDGLRQIDAANHQTVYEGLQLMELHGIKERNCARLNKHGIYSVTEFARADVRALRAAFEGISGYFWHLRLNGWEIDDAEFGRYSFGNSFSLPVPHTQPEQLGAILMKLVERTSARMRKGGYACRGAHLALLYKDGDYWHRGMSLGRDVRDARQLYGHIFKLLCSAPSRKPVINISESVYDLRPIKTQQLGLFDDVEKESRLVDVMDHINSKWGEGSLIPALMMSARSLAPDRISFGSAKEIEELVMAG